MSSSGGKIVYCARSTNTNSSSFLMSESEIRAPSAVRHSAGSVCIMPGVYASGAQIPDRVSRMSAAKGAGSVIGAVWRRPGSVSRVDPGIRTASSSAIGA